MRNDLFIQRILKNYFVLLSFSFRFFPDKILCCGNSVGLIYCLLVD